jgi:hypothetical protein
VISEGEYIDEDGSGEVDCVEGEACCQQVGISWRSDEGIEMPRDTGCIKFANPAVAEYGLKPSVGGFKAQFLS